MTIDELIAALEKAEGPSRELNRGIAISLGWAFDGNGWQEPDGTRHSGIDEYTSSLDAAMTLVPEGAWWDLCAPYGESKEARGAVYPNGGDQISARHRHPAIALCIAALMARRNA